MNLWPRAKKKTKITVFVTAYFSGFFPGPSVLIGAFHTFRTFARNTGPFLSRTSTSTSASSPCSPPPASSGTALLLEGKSLHPPTGPFETSPSSCVPWPGTPCPCATWGSRGSRPRCTPSASASSVRICKLFWWGRRVSSFLPPTEISTIYERGSLLRNINSFSDHCCGYI